MATTPAMVVVLTAPRPTSSTPSLPWAGAISAGCFTLEIYHAGSGRPGEPRNSGHIIGVVEGLDRRFVISEDVVHRELEGEAVVLSLTTGMYFGLNPTGTHVWRLLEGGATIGEIVHSVTHTFSNPPASVEADVRTLCAELEAKGLVVAVHGA